jgi:hypothetical protein
LHTVSNGKSAHWPVKSVTGLLISVAFKTVEISDGWIHDANIANSFSSIPPFPSEFVYFAHNLKYHFMKLNTDLLLQRRTIRKYTGQDVADDLLDEIIREGCRTSTTAICRFTAS